MKKVAVTVITFAFLFLPTTANAESLVTNQGGNPTYSCPQGSDLVGENCVTPERMEFQPQEVNIPATQINANAEITGYNNTRLTGNSTGELRELGCYGGWVFEGNGQVSGNCSVPIYSYSCTQGTLNGDMCNVPARVETQMQEVLVPASTSPATVTGAGEGSLVANVSALFAPIWNFFWDLLPIISGLVLLLIGVRLAHKALSNRVNGIQ